MVTTIVMYNIPTVSECDMDKMFSSQLIARNWRYMYDMCVSATIQYMYIYTYIIVRDRVQGLYAI